MNSPQKKVTKKKATKKKTTKKKAAKKKATKKKATKKKTTKKKAAKRSGGGRGGATRGWGRLGEDAIDRIYDALSETVKPVSDLEYSTPFELLVAVVLSAQATDVSVNIGTRQLYPKANTPEAISALGVEGLTPFIKHIGLFNTKARNVIALCDILIDEHGSEVPADRKSLEALPGVGRKTANVVLNVAFGQPTIAVDTHVHRVANRLEIADTGKPLDTERVLLERTPERHLLHAHHYLILHGRYTCKARKPLCEKCPIVPDCVFPDKVGI
jgi:endonuclease III